MSVLKFIAVISFCSMTGCGAACQTERSIVNALGSGIDAADVAVRDRGGEDYERHSKLAHAAHQAGLAGVRMCEIVRDRAGWQELVNLALERIAPLVAAFTGAGPADVAEPVPIDLLRAKAMLEHETSVP